MIGGAARLIWRLAGAAALSMLAVIGASLTLGAPPKMLIAQGIVLAQVAAFLFSRPSPPSDPA